MCNVRDNQEEQLKQHDLPEWSAQQMVPIVTIQENVIYSPKDAIQHVFRGAFQIELEIGQSMACFQRRGEHQSRLMQGPLGKNIIKNREENQEQKRVCYIIKMKKCSKKILVCYYFNVLFGIRHIVCFNNQICFLLLDVTEPFNIINKCIIAVGLTSPLLIK